MAEAEPRGAPRRRLAWAAALVLAGALAGALLSSAHQYLSGSARGFGMWWGMMLWLQLTYWLSWAVLAPLVYWVAFGRRGAARLAWRVVLGGAAALALQPAVQVGLRALVEDLRFPFAALYGTLGSRWLLTNVYVFAALAGAGSAVRFYRESRARERVAAELRVQLAQARLDALRAQLNPHFLFNALNSVSMLVRLGSSAQAVQVVAGLSRLLRHALDEETPQLVPLRRELDFVREYLEIERIRHGERLSVAFDVDPAVENALVPSFVLQPLAENAVRHGSGSRPGPAAVAISARAEGGVLVLAVADDGPGFPEVRVPAGGGGIGLRNTAVRLAQLYGGYARLERANRPGGGAEVTVRLPLQTA